MCLQEIFSGITIRKMPDGATLAIYPLVTLPVCSFGNAKCNIVGLDCVVACCCPFHSFKPTLNTVFYAETLYSCFTLSCRLFLSCLLSHSLSLSCVFSLSHTLVIAYIYIYTSWSTENSSDFNPCCRKPVQHTVTQSTDHLLIQSHTNTLLLLLIAFI